VTARGYDEIGPGYSAMRRADPRLHRAILEALGGARSVANVGAGAGSYEPTDREVIAVEPSPAMIAQRTSSTAPVVQARAEAIPFRAGSFEAALAILTAHHWHDIEAGLRELDRVASRRVVIVTVDIETMAKLWLIRDYFPEIAAFDRRRFPTPQFLADAFGRASVQPVAIPADSTDGFTPAYWRRPEAFLDPSVRASQSSFAILGDEVLARGLAALAHDLGNGTWRRRNRELLELSDYDGGLRLVVAEK
jgi:SAM-dependent methyltransferase